MGYWSKVFRRIILLLIAISGLFLCFKVTIFYMPFLIAFIISIIVEPMIKFIMKKTKFTRKNSAIIVLVLVFFITIGILILGITSLIAEASNLLQGLNGYVENAYIQIQELINKIDLSKIKMPDNVTKTIQEYAFDLLGTISGWLKRGLTSIVNGITAIPKIAIYIVITLLSTYFVCTDKLYILDQIEHHMPKTWVKRIGTHIKELINVLGNYLKAQIVLILISFFISLIGLYIYHFIGLNVQYPLLMALFIGFVDALPILGSGTVMVPWGIISAFNGEAKLGIWIIVLWVIMSIVRQFIEPKIVSKHIGIHPIFTLIAMYTGFKFIGVIGMLVGPIVLIIVKNIFGTIIDKGIIKTIFDRK